MKKSKLIMMTAIATMSLFNASCSNKAADNITYLFNGNGGILVSGLEKQIVNNPQFLVMPSYEKDGYNLVGWDVVEDAKNNIVNLSAKWEAIKYKITFMNGNVVVATNYVVPGSIIVYPDDLESTATSTFVGWSPKIEVMPNHDVVINAVFNTTLKLADIAVVTDVGLLMDGGYNQETREGAKSYADLHNKKIKYYQPENGFFAKDTERIKAMEKAIDDGAEIIVTPGFLQANAIEHVATLNPEIKFVFVDGWAIGLDNVTAIVYKEQELGFLAGYATVKDGFTKLGGVFGGGGYNPACNRYAYGFIQGINAAAKEMNLPKAVDMKLSFKHGATFSASSELQILASGWYKAGTEVIFSCGGSMINSVIAACESSSDKWVIGSDVDQATLSGRVITSAKKGIKESVDRVLGQYYGGKWNSKLSDTEQNMGVNENAVGLPTANSSWRFRRFTKAQYETVYNKIVDGDIYIQTELSSDMNSAASWSLIDLSLPYCNILFE